MERVPSPLELSQNPSLHHPSGGLLESISSPKLSRPSRNIHDWNWRVV